MRLLKASLLKLVRRPATARTLLVLAAAVAFIYLGIGLSARALPDAQARASVEPLLAFPDAYTGLASLLLMFAGIAGAAYGGTVAASEWSWSTFRVALTRGESRVRYVVGLFVAIVVLSLGAWLALYVLGVGAILVAGALGGVPVGDPLRLSDPVALPVLIACGGWALVMEVAIGFGVSFVTRSPVAGVATVVGLTFIEQLAALLVPIEVLRFAPISAAGRLISAVGSTGLDTAILLPLAVTTSYLLLAIGLAVVVGRRAQVA